MDYVNSTVRDYILTSVTLELYGKLELFQYASDMLRYLEARFGKENQLLKTGTST
jgi:hypothetical protein